MGNRHAACLQPGDGFSVTQIWDTVSQWQLFSSWAWLLLLQKHISMVLQPGWPSNQFQAFSLKTVGLDWSSEGKLFSCFFSWSVQMACRLHLRLHET